MLENDHLPALRHEMGALYPSEELIRPLLELSGVDLVGLELSGRPAVVWRQILDEVILQGPDCLESLLVELQERHPGLKMIDPLLRRLARGELAAPRAAEGGGGLGEAVVKDPLDGTDILIAFAEARGASNLIVIQLKRCRQILLEIAQERQQHGRTLVREKRWRQTVQEIMELAHQLEA